MARPAPRPSSTVGLARPLAGFAVFCGLVLLLMPSRPDPASLPPAKPTVVTKALAGLEHAQQAQQALGEANYGEVRDHLARTQESLTWILGQAQGAEHPPPH